MPKGDEPTIKQRKWLQAYLETGNATEAAMQTYDVKNRNSASQIGWENLRKLDYIDFLEQAGISDALLVTTLLDGLSAVRETPIGSPPDYISRHKYMETGLKLKKRLIDKSEVEHTGEVTQRVILDAKPSDDVKRYKVLKSSESSTQTD